MLIKQNSRVFATNHFTFIKMTTSQIKTGQLSLAIPTSKAEK